MSALGKQPFIEDLQAEARDPLAPDTVGDFDWPDLFARLGEVVDRLPDERDRTELASAFRTLLAWLCEPAIKTRFADVRIGRRCLALAWTLDPAIIEGSPSLTALARTLGVDKVSLSVHAADARRTFGIVNRAQAHGWNFKKTKP